MKTTLALAMLSAGLLGAAAGKLEIYYIDVEGGAATLIVGPTGESLLVDTGNPAPDDRDARRIHEAATRHAGLKRLDHVLITHFHGDHVGGLEALSKLMPVRRFLDHGESAEQNSGWTTYQRLSANNRLWLKPGDTIPVKGLDIRIVASNGQKIMKPINGGGPNALCKDATLKDTDHTDNAQSAGFLLTFGRFKFLDLGDLTWNKEHALACPDNLIGTVDLYQVTHHGLDASGAPQHVWAVRPKVAIMNNGPRKGGAVSTLENLRKSPGLEDIWQLHYSEVASKEQNTAENMIANPTPTADCKGHWIKVAVEKNGRYTVTNSRNNFSKSYKVK
jgi:beta-lactamase superfamily II metal-dependent hydrolase